MKILLKFRRLALAGWLAAGLLGAVPSPAHDPPVPPCTTNWCELVECLSPAYETFSDIYLRPGTNFCQGSEVYARPEPEPYTSFCGEARVVILSSPPGTNCPPDYLTNSFCPMSKTNWCEVTGPNLHLITNQLSIRFTPTHCGDYTLSFHEVWTNPPPCSNGPPCGAGGSISISTNFTVVNVDIVETQTNICACGTASFALTNTCGGVTWELDPPAGPGDPQISGGVVTAGTNCGSWTVTARSTNNPNCTDSASLVVVKVEDLSPEWWANPVTDNPPTWIVCAVPANAPVTNIMVSATPCPAVYPPWDETNLPSCWTMSGGLGTNRLFRTVDITYPHTNVIVCTAGTCSTKTNIIIVQEVKLTLANTNVLVNADDDNANGTNDVNDATSGAGSSVSGENDLIALTLSVQGSATNELVTLSAETGWWWGGQIRVWANATRGPGEPLIDSEDWDRLATNWPISSLPSTVWVEGVTASDELGDVALSLSAPFSCAFTTNLTVFDVTSVSFQTNISPVLDNATLGGPGGGLAIYPDKPTPGSTGDYSSVKVMVNVQPALTNLQVFLRSFDVDDPSNGTTNAPPLDDETAGPDNKATSNPAGRLGGGGDTIPLLTDTNGVAWTNFNVTMQPGDNFRVVASLLADFQNDMHALQTNDHGALAWNNSTNEIPVAYMTDMLTVWRRLHVEVDSMAAVPAGSNAVFGNVIGLLGDPSNGATQAVLSVNLVTELTPNDNSPNLDSGSNGRFEHGRVLVGTYPNWQQHDDLLGNGNDFIRTTNGQYFNFPFTITSTNNISTSGQVWSLSTSGGNSVFGVTTPLAPNQYNGGTIVVLGQTYTVYVNGTSSVSITTNAAFAFELLDDDDNTLLPRQPDVSGMADIWRPACVLPLFDTGCDTTNDAFHLNSHYPGDLSHWSEGRGSPTSTADYWVVMVKNGFQTSVNEDNDANNEGTWRGAGPPSVEAALLLEESIRDWIATPTNSVNGGGGGMDPDPTGAPSRQTRRQEICNHEVGHLFGLLHADGDPTPTEPLGGVMAPTCCLDTTLPAGPGNWVRRTSIFSNTSLDRIRRRPKPGT